MGAGESKVQETEGLEEEGKNLARVDRGTEEVSLKGGYIKGLRELKGGLKVSKGRRKSRKMGKERS